MVFPFSPTRGGLLKSRAGACRQDGDIAAVLELVRAGALPIEEPLAAG
jgi:hypothetical protein